jgi:lysophospholipase L1-like esterase
MEYFYLYIFILLCFIIAVSYWTTINSTNIESFNSDKQTFILLGDSIFQNDAYVSDGKSVNNLLLERTNGKSICLAVDHSKIVDIYDQVLKIPDNLNSSSTTIFLSAGGNDILNHYVDDNNDITNKTILGTIFAAYKNVIKSIKNKIPNANIVLLDIYYPENITYKQYHPIIKEWNEMIYNYARESKNNIKGVLKISGILTKSDDFTLGIEPSSIGSQKLIEAILSSY